MKLLKDKTCIITGGGRGIGKAIAGKFAANGGNIAICDIAINDEVEKNLALLRKNGIKAEAFACDVSKLDDCAELAEKVISDFESIDVLVNNAGITRDNLMLRMSESEWDTVLTVNLKSCFNMIKGIQRTMLKQRSGSIINMSSVVGRKGNAGQVNYSASKAGMIGLTKSIALEFGSRGIRSNAIAPGFIETEMTAALDEEVVQAWRQAIPLRRGGTPEDVANAALFLASDLSNYITGQVLSVDGGMYT